MSILLDDPGQTAQEIVDFLQKKYAAQKKLHGVIAVSGGIDSALSATLLTKALGPKNITAVLLPYADQSMTDSLLLTKHLGLPEKNVVEIHIKSMVDSFTKSLQIAEKDLMRQGNIKARVRMVCVFDIAKKLDALVCGTENKSEHYLGYFTRFGDAASDIEPISTLYKTQVRQLVKFLQLPSVFLEKPPSAGLWTGQTDEEEMGFSYEDADTILHEFIDHKKTPDGEVAKKVLAQVAAMKFKREVPYSLTR